MAAAARSVLWAALLLVTGRAAQGQTSEPQAAVAPPVPAYRFEIGDLVEFKFPFSSELDFTARVRPDGAVYFPYLGDRSLFDLGPAELAAQLREAYKGILKEPEITVTVREFRAPRVFVTGEVTTPGPIEYRRGVTALQALAGAGGYRETASREALVVLRPSGASGALRVMAVDLKTRRGQPITDLMLAPEDIVLVPRSGIAKVNQVIRQYVRGVLPVSSLGFFFDLLGASSSASISPGGPNE